MDDKELERIMTENLETDPDEWFKVVQSLKTDQDSMAIKICELATKQLVKTYLIMTKKYKTNDLFIY